MAFYGTDFDHAQHQLSRRIAGLTRDASHLGDQLRRFGGHASRDVQHFAHDLSDQALHQGTLVARGIGKVALRTGKAVGRDPLPAIVAVAGLACLVSLVLASGRPHKRR